jgi:hypothetical protein
VDGAVLRRRAWSRRECNGYSKQTELTAKNAKKKIVNDINARCDRVGQTSYAFVDQVQNAAWEALMPCSLRSPRPQLGA